jgi:hypothetical protein
MNKVQGVKVAAGTEHLHTISDVALANNICDAYSRPVQYIVNGERVEYTLEDLTTELERRGGYASESTAEVTQHMAKCSCGMYMPLMPGMVARTCNACNITYHLPELTYGLHVTITGTRN